MYTQHFFFLLLFVLLFYHEMPPHNLAAEPPKPGPLTLEQAQQLVNGAEYSEARFQRIVNLGDAVFPAFKDILQVAESKPIHVVRIFHALVRHPKKDTTQFIPLAIERLADEKHTVRHSAIRYLEHAGREEDTPLLFVMLSDPQITVAVAASRAISVVGSAKDLRALSLWLTNYKPATTSPEQLRELDALRVELTKHRDELKARLDRAQKAGIPK